MAADTGLIVTVVLQRCAVSTNYVGGRFNKCKKLG